MIRLIYSLAVLLIVQIAQAQNPVHWEYSSKKISANNYEIRIKATIDDGWHIYSTTQKGIGLPTSINFNKNPLVTIAGKIKEEGTLESHHVEVLDVTNLQFENTVTFVQKVTLKGKVKTTVNGKIDFMACTDQMCLPPASTTFTVNIGE